MAEGQYDSAFTGAEMDAAFGKAHGHDNKTVLDGISDIDGALTYKGTPVDGDGGTASGEYVHLSVDDVTICLQSVKANAASLSSVFQNTFLGGLKALHDEYGAVFSLYCYGDSTTDLPTKFQAELSSAAHWLKFGIHSKNPGHTFASETAQSAAAIYNSFVENALAFAGSTAAIDRFPRLHEYRGSLEAMAAMRDCPCGLLGALTPEALNDCPAYYLNDNQKQWIANRNRLLDPTNGLVFYRTAIRTDWFESSADWSAACPESNGSIQTLLTAWKRDPLKADAMKALIIFGHEWKTNILTRFQQVCQWAADNGYRFAFPQAVDLGIASFQLAALGEGESAPQITQLAAPTGLSVSGTTLTWTAVANASSYMIRDSGTQIGTSSNASFSLSGVTTVGTHPITVVAVGDGTSYANSQPSDAVNYIVEGSPSATITNAKGETLTVLTYPSEGTYVSATVNTGENAGSIGTYPANQGALGRAAMSGAVIGVSGGETVNLTQGGKDAISGLAFTLYEFSAAPVSQATATSDGLGANSWKTAAFTLQTATRYIIPGFKNGDRTVLFTGNELAALGGYLAIT
jgi:hypothetical protein